MFVKFVKTLSYVSIQEEKPLFNAETEKVIADAKKKKGVFRVSDYEKLVEKLSK